MNSSRNNRDQSNRGIANLVTILSKQKTGLKICHINAQSLAPKIDEFRHIFENSDIDIVCVSETWFKPDITSQSVSMNGFNLIRIDRNGHAGGVAIYVRKGIFHKVICGSNDTNNNSLIEYGLIEVISEGKKLLLGSLYRCNNNISIDPFIDTFEEVSTLYSEVILLGDFNWNLLSNTSLIDKLYSLGLFPTNTATPTHFTSSSGTLIDLIFVSDTKKVLLYDQIVAPCFSKHDLLFLTYDFQIRVPSYSITFRDFSRLNLNTLEREFSYVDWSEIYYMESVDEKLDLFEANLTQLFNRTVPIRTSVIRQTNRPWFSSEIKIAISHRDRAFSRWKRFRTTSLYDEYCTARRYVHKIIKKAKSAYYIEKLSSAMGSKKMWNIFNEIGIGKSKRSETDTFDPEEINNKFVNLPMLDADFNYYNYSRDDNLSSFSFNCVTYYEVIKSCMAIKSNATGVDNINPKFLKILLPKLIPYITHIINTIITTSCYPGKWKIAKVIPIPKTRGEYRPIAILPFMSKVLERILHNQISLFVNEQNLLCDEQSGFRDKNSCITALVDVAEDLRSGIDDRKTNFLVLLDHSRAFDAVDHSLMCYKLENMFMFSTTATRLISTYLCNRYQYVQNGENKSSLLPVVRGVPQGSIIGPLLFSLYANDLPKQLKHCKIRMYADDVQIYISCVSSEIERCVVKLNADLERVYRWATANGLSINPSKSRYLVVQKRTVDISVPDIYLNNLRLERVSLAKNLGIIFNSNLTWSDHVNYVCGRTYSVLRTLWATQSCVNIKMRTIIAKTYLMPIMLYGCELFANCDVISKNKLNKLFRNITRYVYGVRRYDSVSMFTAKLYNMEFENLLKTRVLIFLHKIVSSRLPSHLYNRLTFLRSSRGKGILNFRHRCLTSEWQFFVNAVRLWNSLPYNLQTISNASSFKRAINSFFCPLDSTYN